MRNFEERIAEIGRRSEKIWKQRKQRRKHILMACIPAALCVGIFSAFILPDKLPTDDKNAGITEGVMDIHTESMTCAVTKIEVSGQKVSLSFTDPAEIQRITNQLRRCGVETVETNSASDQVPDGDTANESKAETTVPSSRGDWISDGVPSDSTTTGYTLTLVISGEEPAEYCLFGNTLENRSTGEIYTLTQAQANVLYHLLGLPQP